jgi:hypothetical protein
MFEAPAAGTTTAANRTTQTVPQGWHAQHSQLIAVALTVAATPFCRMDPEEFLPRLPRKVTVSYTSRPVPIIGRDGSGLIGLLQRPGSP